MMIAKFGIKIAGHHKTCDFRTLFYIGLIPKRVLITL
jgi:hypothetical protein